MPGGDELRQRQANENLGRDERQQHPFRLALDLKDDQADILAGGARLGQRLDVEVLDAPCAQEQDGEAGPDDVEGAADVGHGRELCVFRRQGAGGRERERHGEGDAYRWNVMDVRLSVFRRRSVALALVDVVFR